MYEENLPRLYSAPLLSRTFPEIFRYAEFKGAGFMYYVYLIKSMKYNEIYIGSTNDLRRRMTNHNNGTEISTRRYKPWRLVYYEAFRSEKDAREREMKLKHHGNAMRELKKRIQRSLKSGGALPRTTFDGAKSGGALPRTTFDGAKSGAGFTLIELLIAISIITILFTLGVAQYIKFNRQQILDQAVLELKTNLTQARNTALAGKKTCVGGFDGILVEAISEQGYRIRSQCDGGLNIVTIEEHWFSQGVRRTSGLGTGILFKPLTGGTNLNSDETITLSLPGVNSARVQVTPSGKIELIE